MEDNSQFMQQLEAALNQKQEWFNSSSLPEVLNQYRVLNSSARNIFELLKKKGLLVPDPYITDSQISDVVTIESTGFTDNEIPTVLGERFSIYDSVLDYLSNYFKFTVNNLPSSKIKKLLEFNNFIDWTNVSPSNAKPNTHALGTQLVAAKINAPAIVSGMISDCISKSAEAVQKINKILQELAVFQKELFKVELRHDIFSHPDFNKQNAYSSAEAEFAEIKSIYSKVMGKKPFYKDLINEIIMEDQGQNKESLQIALLKKLEIHDSPKKQNTPQIKKNDTKLLILNTLMALGGMSSTLEQLRVKLTENFNIFYSNKTSLLKKMGNFLRKLFKSTPKERICTIKVIEPRTGNIKEQDVNVNNLLNNLAQKVRIYSGIASQGMEYQKLAQYPEDKIFNFATKQISECQALFSTINGLDSFFKTEVDVLNRPKIKGLQIELSVMRNAIIVAQKKRTEYLSVHDESQQLSDLGI